MPESKLDLLQGTLDVMVLQTLAVLGPLHGYGIARRIEQVSGDQVLLNQGTIYASLVRLQQRGWISARWGTSENNRKAKFYSITTRGRKQLNEDMAYWQRLSEVMARVIAIGQEERSHASHIPIFTGNSQSYSRRTQYIRVTSERPEHARLSSRGAFRHD